jgi:hypothetical protein
LPGSKLLPLRCLFFAFTILLCTGISTALSNHVRAQDLTYDAPLRGPLLVTGTFGELRGDHFHAGLDFRAPTGTPVYAVADGYVSRIKVTAGGYGQAIYVDHPDGHRSVYGHLETLVPELLDTLRSRQFAEEEFEQEMTFDAMAFPVCRGQQLGGVGNRGYSFGSHLHFEMREIVGDVPLNPLAFGFSVPDGLPPTIRNLRLYELDEAGLEVSTQTIEPTLQRDGNYVVTDTLIVGQARIGLALKTYDRQDAMPNWNGIYGGRLTADTTAVFDFAFHRIPFEQTEYLNALTDYADWTENKSWYHRFWALSPTQFRARPQGAKEVGKGAKTYDGTLRLRPEVPLPVRLEVYDHAGNVTTCQLTLLYRLSPASPRPRPHQYFLPAGEASIIDKGDFRLELPADVLYRDCFFRYARLPDTSAGHLSAFHQLDSPSTPLHGQARLAIRPMGNVANNLRPHAFLGQCNDDGEWSSRGGEWQADGRMVANISTFGDYALFLDTIPPTVTINAFATDLRRASGFSIYVKDNVKGRWPTYRATIDGAWALLEFDGKSDKLNYNFADGDPGPGEHLFEITVNDGRGNATVWQRRFRR